MMFPKLKKRKKIAIIICCLFLFGGFIGRIGQIYFRFSDLRIIYHICWISNYVLVIGPFIWSVENSIFIIKDGNFRSNEKLMWGFISLLPFLYFSIMITFVVLRT